MQLSIFDIFKIGIGPSSSHTVGPMAASLRFVQSLQAGALLQKANRVQVDLFGSLGATGRGHASDLGVILGLLGESPHSVQPETIPSKLDALKQTGQLTLLGVVPITFDPLRDIVFRGTETLPQHPNAIRLTATDKDCHTLAQETYFSVGGGFVVHDGETANATPKTEALPHPFTTADELLAECYKNGLSISQLMLRNECVWRPESDVRSGLQHIWQVMQQSVERGLSITNPKAPQTLPGQLRIRRRAPELHQKLLSRVSSADPLAVMDWVDVFAMAVSEENAAGGRVVTAPTNGAAGVIPAVLHYYLKFIDGASDRGAHDFLLTAAAIAILYKTNASISGAEVGCQGEVGVACSMAAGALAAVLGATPEQVENAAEIGMEHNLGLTCDPVGGLVQIPCIERNAMGAIKAINAARLAMNGNGKHVVSLDTVIRTMKQTGEDMKSTYKETSLGGLAVNVVEC